MIGIKIAYYWVDKLLKTNFNFFFIMKLNFTRVLALVVGVIVFYAACKKMEHKPAAKLTVDYKALSSKIAVNLYRSLVGAYGGTSINSGVSLPKTANHKVLGYK